MGKSQRQVLGLYRLIVNPSLRPAYERYKSAWKDVQVVVYTRRPNLLLYRSIVNGQILNLRYSAHWHDAGHQLHVPPEMKSADDVFAHYCGEELAEDEVHDIKKSLERLLCARDVIAEELGLTTPPSVVVTAKEKDIDLTARHLGLDAKNSGDSQGYSHATRTYMRARTRTRTHAHAHAHAHAHERTQANERTPRMLH